MGLNDSGHPDLPQSKNAALAHARRAYEWGRLRYALVGAVPVLVVAGIAVHAGGRPSWTAPFACAVFVTTALALWYGREPKRAVLPGFLAGLVPAALTFCTMHFGHYCFGNRCTDVCLAACLLGGVSAGALIGLAAVRRRFGWRFAAAASTISVLTGALGCACLGYAGLAGLAAGYAFGLAPAFATTRLRQP